MDEQFVRDYLLGDNLDYTMRILLLVCTTVAVITWLVLFYRRKLIDGNFEDGSLRGMILCPHCSAHLEDRLANKIKRTGAFSIALIRCDCGTVSEWNMIGFPPELIRFTVPTYINKPK